MVNNIVVLKEWKVIILHMLPLASIKCEIDYRTVNFLVHGHRKPFITKVLHILISIINTFHNMRAKEFCPLVLLVCAGKDGQAYPILECFKVYLEVIHLYWHHVYMSSSSLKPQLLHGLLVSKSHLTLLLDTDTIRSGWPVPFSYAL